MKAEDLHLLIILFATVGAFTPSQMFDDDYWKCRAEILHDEDIRRTGGDLELKSVQEGLANRTLMNAKFKELDDGFRAPSTFLPARNFMQVSSNISNSSVFKIIQKMPKGAVLHANDYKITSFDYVFHNITFRPNLYICDTNSTLNFKFFDKPSNDCKWQLLSDVRKNDKNGTINARIVHQLTMFAEDLALAYPDDDSVWVQLQLVIPSLQSLMSYRPVFEDHFYQGLLELYEDNVFYIELRTVMQPLYDIDGKEYGILEVAHIYKNITDRFMKDHPNFLGVKLIYNVPRESTNKQMAEYLSTARMLLENLPGFIVGLDTYRQNDNGKPLVDFADQLREASKDVPFFFHAGETKWNGQKSDEDLIDAVLLGTKRIGHGFGLTKHPRVLELARQKGLAVELQPIFIQILNLVKDLRNHPASVLFANNYPIVVGNSDPGLWGAKGLSYDFYEAFMGIMSRRADLRALKKLAINSIEYSSMNATEKKHAMEIWQQKWNQFVKEVAADL